MRILVVDDEKDLNQLIVEKLRLEGYAVDACYDGNSALEYLLIGNYDCVILDIMLPGLSGYEVLEQMHRNKIFVPVMFLSARTESEDIVRGLDEGADDYLVKPFDFEVLLARLRVMLRKKAGIHSQILRCGDLEMDVAKKLVVRDGEHIDLTAREFALLQYLLLNHDIVLSREQILSSVWNDNGEICSNVVDVYVRLLRKKVDSPFENKMIHTVRGSGYFLREG